MITHRGYKLDISKLSDNEKKKIRDDLTIKPEAYVGTLAPYPIYRVKNKFVYIPRYYGINNFSNDDKNNCKNFLLCGENVTYDIIYPNFSLRERQRIAMQYIMIALLKYGTCILRLGCGDGKTASAIYLSHKLNAKTLVVVHRKSLMIQWHEEINKFTNAKVGRIHGKTIDVDDKDIILTTVQTVIRGNYIDEYKKIRLTILDECHHLSAKEFHKTLKKINTKYIMGLTATPNKGEKMRINHVFKHFIGPIVPPESAIKKLDSKNDNKGNVIVNVLNYNVDHGLLSKHLVFEFDNNKPNTSGMVTNIANTTLRNQMIVNYIVELCKDPIRKILVISDRKAQLNYLNKELENLNIINGLYTGKQTSAEQQISKGCQVILGIYQLSEEGLNVEDINTILYATPRRDNSQSIGRPFRKLHKIPVIIIDIIDTFSSTLINQGKSRCKLYNAKDRKYYVVYKEINDNNNYPELEIKLNKK